MGNSKSTLNGHVMTVESNGTVTKNVETSHLETHSRGTQFRSGKQDCNNEPPEKRQRMSEVDAGERRDVNGPSHTQNKLEDNNNAQEKGDDGLFRNPAEIPRRKQRPRPEPLTIPPSASTNYYSNRPGSPLNRSRPCSPPYTPPPMLSPHSIYHVNSLGNLTPRLSASYQPPMTPGRLQLLSSHSHRSKPFLSLFSWRISIRVYNIKLQVGKEHKRTGLVVGPSMSQQHLPAPFANNKSY